MQSTWSTQVVVIHSSLEHYTRFSASNNECSYTVIIAIMFLCNYAHAQWAHGRQLVLVSVHVSVVVCRGRHCSGVVCLHHVNGGCRSEQPIGHCLPSAYTQWLHYYCNQLHLLVWPMLSCYIQYYTANGKHSPCKNVCACMKMTSLCNHNVSVLDETEIKCY